MLPLYDDIRLSAAKHNSTPHAPAAARNLDAAIPQRCAETELPNIKDLQHTTVEHIALMHQFECTKCLNTCKAQEHSINKEEKKSPGTLSSTAPQIEQESAAKRQCPKPPRAREPIFLCNGTSVYQKKCNVSCKS